MINGLRQIVSLPDPIGSIFDMNYRPAASRSGACGCRLGWWGSSMNRAPTLPRTQPRFCLKSGNATVLRGGSEAFHSNQAIAESIRTGLRQAGLPPDAVQVVTTTDRAAVGSMITMPEYIDVIIPRGGKESDRTHIQRGQSAGNQTPGRHLPCLHRRPGGFEEGVRRSDQRQDPALRHLQHHGDTTGGEGVAEKMLPRLAATFLEKGVELRGCPTTCRLLGAGSAPPMTRTGTPNTWRPSSPYARGAGSGRRYRPHQSTWLSSTPTASSPKTIPGRGASGRSGLQLGDGKCLHPLRRWLRVWLGRGDRHLYRQVSCTRPVGLEGLTSVKYIVLGDGHIRK